MAMHIEQVGARLYVADAPFAMKDKLKAAGCHWDADRRAWWIGLAKRAAVDALVAAPVAAAEETIALDARVIRGRAEYEGKTYYVLAYGYRERDGQPYAKLCYRDGSKVFWAKQATMVRMVRSYEEPTSIASLRAYAEKMKQRQARTNSGECNCSCHSDGRCHCPKSVCPIHFDGCDRCGCERDG